MKREGLAGRCPNEALITMLEGLRSEGKLFFEYALTDDNRIVKMFIADMR